MKEKLSLNEQHDYITLKTPNGNYTHSRYSSKASGKLAYHPTAFKNIDKYVQNEGKTRGLIDVMKDLTNPEILSKLWAEWDEQVPFNLFLPTDKVVFNLPIFLKKYPKGGVVKSVKRKTVYVHLSDTNEVCGFDYLVLDKVN